MDDGGAAFHAAWVKRRSSFAARSHWPLWAHAPRCVQSGAHTLRCRSTVGAYPKSFTTGGEHVARCGTGAWQAIHHSAAGGRAPSASRGGSAGQSLADACPTLCGIWGAPCVGARAGAPSMSRQQGDRGARPLPLLLETPCKLAFFAGALPCAFTDLTAWGARAPAQESQDTCGRTPIRF